MSKSKKPGAKKPAHNKSAAKKPVAKKAVGGAKLCALELAARALAASKTPMNVKDITKRVIALGWRTQEKTPHQTVSAMLSRIVKEPGSQFRKAGRGLFTVNK